LWQVVHDQVRLVIVRYLFLCASESGTRRCIEVVVVAVVVVVVGRWRRLG